VGLRGRLTIYLPRGLFESLAGAWAAALLDQAPHLFSTTVSSPSSNRGHPSPCHLPLPFHHPHVITECSHLHPSHLSILLHLSGYTTSPGVQATIITHLGHGKAFLPVSICLLLIWSLLPSHPSVLQGLPTPFTCKRECPNKKRKLHSRSIVLLLRVRGVTRKLGKL
jgi:hypothetical protein